MTKKSKSKTPRRDPAVARPAPQRPSAIQSKFSRLKILRDKLHPILPDILWLAFFISAALALRLYALGERSLWTDETDTLYFSASVLEKTFMGGPHYLYWLFVHPFVTLSFTAYSLRLFSALCGVVCVPAAYALGRLWFGRWSARLLAAAVAVSPYLVFYSREARYYAAMILVSFTSLILLTLLMRRPHWWLVILFAACQVLGIGIHPTMLVFSLAQALFLLGLGALWLLREFKAGSLSAKISRLKKPRPALLTLGAFVLFGSVGYLLLRHPPVPLSQIFSADSNRHATNVDLTFGFIAQPFLQFFQMPRTAPSRLAAIFFLSSLLVGFALCCWKYWAWVVLFVITWALTLWALWIFPSDNNYRLKYISFLYPLIFSPIVLPWARGIEALIARPTFSKNAPLGWAAALSLILLSHVPFLGGFSRILREGRRSFGAAVDEVVQASQEARVRPILFTDMPGYYGVRAEWEIEDLPFNSLVYVRHLQYGLPPEDASVLIRHLLAKPAVKWSCVLRPEEAVEGERGLLEHFAPGFEQIANYPPTLYDLWDYEVPLAVWKHHTSTVIPPGPSLVPLIDRSPLNLGLHVNDGAWHPTESTWEREIYVALPATYRFSVRSADNPVAISSAIVMGTLAPLGADGSRISLSPRPDGSAEAGVPEGFYRVEMKLSAEKSGAPLDPLRSFVAVEEVTQGRLYFRPEFFRATSPEKIMKVKQLGPEESLIELPMEVLIDYPVHLLEAGAFDLDLRQAVVDENRLPPDVSAEFDSFSLGAIRRTVARPDGSTKSEYGRPRMQLSAGAHSIRFRFSPPDPDLGEPAKGGFFAGFYLTKVPGGQ